MTPMERWFTALFSDEVEGTRLDLNPNDPGNYTPDGRLLGSQCGISAHSYPDAPFGKITPAMAAGMAKHDYWDRHGLDELPHGVAILMADSYYNGGDPVRWLQRALNTTVDGIIGPVTRHLAANDYFVDRVGLLRRFTRERIAYHAGINQPWEMRGWANRDLIMLLTALETP